MLFTRAKIKRISLEATVIRADGTVEHLGEVASWDSNPFVRAWTCVKRFFSGHKAGVITRS